MAAPTSAQTPAPPSGPASAVLGAVRPAALRWGWRLAALLAVAIYLPSLRYDFVYDDGKIVQLNTRIRNLADWRKYLATSWWDEQGLNREYRPLPMASFALDFALSGDRPAPYHAVNVALNGLAAALVWALAWRLFRRRDLALAAAVLFAIHPLHVEAVAGIVGRAELMMTVGFLAALLAAHASLRARGLAGRIGWAAAVLPAALLALFSKEHGVMLAPAIALLALLPPEPEAAAMEERGPGPDRARFGRGLRALAPALAAALLATALYFVARRIVLGAFFLPAGSLALALDNPLYGVTGLPRLLSAIEVLALNALLMVAPFHPSPDYSMRVVTLVRDVGDPLWLPGLLVMLAAVAGVWLWRRWPAALFGLLFMIVSYLVGSNLILTIGTMMAERLLYLPSVGFCVLAAALALEAPARIGRPSRAGSIALGIFAFYCAALLVQHARYLPQWRNNQSLLTYLVHRVPNDARAHVAYGMMLSDQGRNQEALSHMQRALEIYPENLEAIGFSGLIYERLGENQKALDYLRRAFATNPGIDLVSANLARVCEKMGLRDEAERVLRQALAAAPGSYANHLEMGLFLCDEGRWQEAIADLEVCLPVVLPADRPRLESALTRARAALAEKK